MVDRLLVNPSARFLLPALLALLLALSGCEHAGGSADTPAPVITPVASMEATAAAAAPQITASPAGTAAPPPTIPPVATPAPSATLTRAAAVCTEARGSVESRQIKSAQYGTGTAFVYLPPCYTPNPARRYPVLYLLHGANTDNTQWVQIGVPDDADALIRSGFAPGSAQPGAPPFLVVMPKEAQYAQDPDASKYGAWIVHALVPWVDQNYPTCATRACRAIGGLSRGGSWAFRIGLTDWQDFGAMGMNSFAPFYGDFAAMPAWLAQIPTDQRPRIYLDIGKQDSLLPDALAVDEKLTSLHVPHVWHLREGGHNRAYWRMHVTEYLQWYAEEWK